MKDISSAFWLRLQGDNVDLVELITLDHPNLAFRWTTSNENIVSSGETYIPFPGESQGALEESSDLTIPTAQFTFANSGSVLDDLLRGGNFDAAEIAVNRVFTDTPDLGRMSVFRGRLADIQYTRSKISGQVRGKWGSAQQNWPGFSYKDNCTLRFGSTPCGVNTSSVTVAFATGDIGSGTYVAMELNSGTITQSYSNGYFDYGRLTFTSGLNSGEVRTIRAGSGDQFDFSHRLPYVANTGSFEIYPGCRKRIIDDCTSKYNNQANALAFPWIPIQEDFGSDV